MVLETLLYKEMGASSGHNTSTGAGPGEGGRKAPTRRKRTQQRPRTWGFGRPGLVHATVGTQMKGSASCLPCGATAAAEARKRHVQGSGVRIPACSGDAPSGDRSGSDTRRWLLKPLWSSPPARFLEEATL